MTVCSIEANEASSYDEGRLWPLPLTPFEKFMVLDDRPNYPMTFFGELRFKGELRRAEFARAVQTAVKRHPLFRARVVHLANGMSSWVPVENDEVTPDWGTISEPIARNHGGRLNIGERAGMRVSVRCGDNSSYVVWQFHHACCDGHGAMRFLEDVLTGYAAATVIEGFPPNLRPLDPHRLAARGDFSRGIRQAAEHPQPMWYRLRDAFRFHCFGPQPLGPRTGAAPVRGSFPGVFSRFFDDAESIAIRSAVAIRSGTLNDAAIVAVLRTLHDWNREQGIDGGRGRLRVLMPIDLRMREDESLPAANRMTFGFITRRVGDVRDPRRLLDGVREETQFVRRTGIGLDFLHALTALERSAWLAWLLKRPRCLATAVLTNMGDPTRRFAHRFPRSDGRCVVGDVVLESITGSPPLRPLTRVGFGIGTYAGRIVINAKCDPTLFSDDDAQYLLTMFAERLLAGCTD